MSDNPIKYEFKFHRGKDSIFLRFDFDEKLNNRVKRLKGIKWSHKQKAWYLDDTSENRHRFELSSIFRSPRLKLIKTKKAQHIQTPNGIISFCGETLQI